MHTAVKRFAQTVKARYPGHFTAASVLEVGAHNVNGSIRDLFGQSRFIGIDPRPGPNVDTVCCAHELPKALRFDTAIATEVFEHDPHLHRTICAMLQRLKPGGLFLATCAGPQRPEHETACSPLPGYYANVTIDELTRIMANASVPLAELHAEYGRQHQDLYAWAITA